MMKMPGALGLIFLLMISTAAMADTVILNNGSSYSGKVTNMSDKQLVLQDAQGVEIRIPRSKVRQVSFGDTLGITVQPQQSQQMAPALQPGEQDASLRSAMRPFGGGVNRQQLPSNYKKVSVRDVLSLPVGTAVAVEGRYGRLKKPTTGMPQNDFSWFLNDSEREVRIVGRIPSGISSYSRRNWGSQVEIKGVLSKSGAYGTYIKAVSTRVIKQSNSQQPDNF